MSNVSMQGRLSSNSTTTEDIRATNGATHTQSSGRSASAVTPHDTNANVWDALWIGVTGNVAVRLADDTAGSVIFTNVPVGWFPVNTSLVLATGTTATGIIGVKWSA